MQITRVVMAATLLVTIIIRRRKEGAEAAYRRQDDMDSRLVVDYVQFHAPRRVCLFRLPGGEGPWLALTHRRLVTLSLAYVALMPTTHLEATCDSNHNQSHTLPHSLIVLRVESEKDARIFHKVFPVVSVWCSWLLLLPNTQLSQWLDYVYLPINSRVTVAAYSEEEPAEAARLWQVYQVSPNLEKKALASGVWSPGTPSPGAWRWLRDSLRSGETLRGKGLTFGRMAAVTGDPLLRRSDLTGLHLSCTTISAIPRTILKFSPNGTVQVDGIFGNVFTTLQSITNFTYTCRPSRDGQWGALVDGRWTGMMRDLVEGEADMAVASLDITQERGDAVDFLLPVSHTRYFMVIKRPSNNDHMWSTYTREFHVNVWLVMTASVLVFIVTLYLASFTPDEERISLLEAFTIVTGALCGQGCSTKFFKTSANLILLTLMLLQVLLLAHYTSNLVSALTVGPSLPAISSISDVRRNPSLTLTFKRGTSLVDYFKNSRNPDHQAVWQSIVSSKYQSLVSSSAEGMKKVLKEKYVYLDSHVYLTKGYGRDCRFYIIQRHEFSGMNSFALKKGSPIVPVLNNVILKVRAAGVVDRMERRRRRPSTVSRCLVEEGAAIRLGPVLAPFLLLLSAVPLSLLCLALERLLLTRPLSHPRSPST